MDLLDQKLSDDSLNAHYTLPIRAAVNLGKKVINQYYNKTDDTEAFRIAMGMCANVFIFNTKTTCFLLVLHPSHKLAYFKRAKWPADWIKTAEDITRNEYCRSYFKNSPTSMSATHGSSATITMEDMVCTYWLCTVNEY